MDTTTNLDQTAIFTPQHSEFVENISTGIC